jgi:predicted site-specific integrase-resolvase
MNLLGGVCKVMHVSLQEAAKLSHMSERQLLRWINDKKLTAAKDESKRWKIDLADLEDITTIDKDKLQEIFASHGVSTLGLLARVERLEKNAILARIERLEKILGLH